MLNHGRLVLKKETLRGLTPGTLRLSGNKDGGKDGEVPLAPQTYKCSSFCDSDPGPGGGGPKDPDAPQKTDHTCATDCKC